MECWYYLQDQGVYWHEVYCKYSNTPNTEYSIASVTVTFALFTLARAEGKHFERIDYLEKSTAEYGSTKKPRKLRRRPIKQDEKSEEIFYEWTNGINVTNQSVSRTLISFKR
uniref:Uncharacterized protein n=1 Tax=Caenorhabditis tropicalis TaxID=1561998 RepID=A0A1I7ULG0_9PELO